MSTARRGGPRDREPTPVNYRMVPAARQSAVPRKITHERLHADRLTGWLGLELTTLDPVHVGAGAPIFDGREIARAMVVTLDEDGAAPVIPGASLKGAVRNLAELLLGGGAPDDPDVADTAVGGLFGYISRSGEFAGRVGFDDAHALADEPAFGVAKLPHPYQPRKQGARRLYGPPAGPRRGEVPYEVIPRGERFRTRLHLVNVTPGELGAILTCLGLDGTFFLRVGGGKFAGLGRVRAEVTGAALRSGYEQPGVQRLDAASARALAEMAIEQRTLAKDFEQPLEQIRRALGGAG